MTSFYHRMAHFVRDLFTFHYMKLYYPTNKSNHSNYGAHYPHNTHDYSNLNTAKYFVYALMEPFVMGIMHDSDDLFY